MADVTVNYNERSWAIEMITQINFIAENNDLLIKRAGGESTVSVNSQLRMFPDVILYGDTNLTTILQGWELKMPDVPITDETFVKDAQRKARALHLDSCVVWNFQYVQFYIYKKETETFEMVRQWSHSQIQTRQDVQTYHDDWERTLFDVVLAVNDYLKTHQLRRISLGDVLSDSAIDLLMNGYKYAVADNLKQKANLDSVMEARLNLWWKEESAEYKFDETDMYLAYARNIILNWAYRILFAHLIKQRQNGALLVDKIDFHTTPIEADEIFKKITARCDFYNVFVGMWYNVVLPSNAWAALVEFSLFLREHGTVSINQTMFQYILERTVKRTKRNFNGQFPTPSVLARMLVKMTVHNWQEDCSDPCCGTGTIPHELIEIKSGKIGMSKAVETTWASDKYKTPLQVANLSMVSCDTINKANRLFQRNALELKVGDVVNIVNPMDGAMMEVSIPSFGAICSNLPFVSFENISDEDKVLLEKYVDTKVMDKKSDLCYGMVLYLSSLLKDNGYLGVIVSNAWLGTKAGEKFYHALTDFYYLEQVHISGNGRWFQNADVVTTILILRKKAKGEVSMQSTSFFVWKKSLENIGNNSTLEQEIVSASLLNKVNDFSVVEQSTYTEMQIENLKSLNISYNAMFHDVLWLLDIKDKLVPLKSLFKVFRGSRRGWDELFFPTDNVKIEKEFLKPALFNAKKLDNLIAKPDRKAFCCGEDLDYLAEEYTNAYHWIKKFEPLKNGVGKPLVEVLARPKEHWYEMKANEVAQFFTMMNPDSRFFFGKFEEPTFINQRLIGLQVKDATLDMELIHALLNSVLMKFFVEAVGFGRGLGVLDINKESVAKCFMLNPSLLSLECASEIKEQFHNVLAKNIMVIEEELKDEEWMSFNRTVLRAFGLEQYYLRICNSLLSMRHVRKTAREDKKKQVLVKNINQSKQMEVKGSVFTSAMAAESCKHHG